ncbi:MAG: VOC family protein [Bacteroidia bacterium]|nr:VOC family protein [Bacteroidia bacterium]
MKIDHTAIWVNDLEGERDFFIKYFDCTVNEKYVNPTKRFSSYFLTFPDGGRIEIMKKNNIGPAGMDISLGYAHIALNAGSREKVDSLTWLMQRNGIIIESGPRVTGDGYYESVILDPENNRIEIVSE